MSPDSFALALPSILTRIQDRQWPAMVELHDQLSETVFQAASSVTNDDLVAELITIGVFVQVWSHPDLLIGSGYPPGPQELSQTMVGLARGRAEAWWADQPPAEPGLAGRNRS